MARILVIGAPIAGLWAARAKPLAGHEPVLLERSRAGGAIGARPRGGSSQSDAQLVKGGLHQALR
jgi:glycine/D-amino acid oxidase-like deaminating enzyme